MANRTITSPVGIRVTRPNGRTEYLTDASCTYVQIGKLVVFSLTYTPKIDVTNAVQNTITNMPSALYPVKVFAVNNDSLSTDFDTNRYALILGTSIHVYGVHMGGVTYTASGAYIAE